MNRIRRRRRRTQLQFETCESRLCLSVSFGTPNVVVDTGSIGVDAVSVGDLDNDLDLDVVTGSDEGIRWIENSGGEFRHSHVVIRTDYNVSQVAVVDIDDDGHGDVVAIVGGYVAWYRNLGQGAAFGPPKLISGAGVTKFTVGDLDTDGDIDFVVQSDRQRLHRITNVAAKFSQVGSMTTTHPIEDFRVRDVNTDLNQDILVATDGAVVLFANKDNEFTAEQILIDDVRPNQIDVHDADGDGLLDIVYSSWRGTAWHHHDGDGVYYGATVLSGQSQNIGFADVDKDGTDDVIFSSWTDDRIAWTPFLQQQKFKTHTIASDLERAGQVFPADLDNDGDVDLISYSGQSGVVKHENHGTGRFSNPERIVGQAFGTIDLSTGDIDGDGDLDLLSVAKPRQPRELSGIAWYENTDGDGTFGAQIIIDYETDDRNVDAILLDMDEDGDLDVVAGFGLVDRRSDAAEFVWYENVSGQGDFSAPKTIVETERRTGRKLAFADIDGDDDNDLIMASAFPQTLEWFANQGDGTFSPQPQIGTGSAPAIVPVDLDADGDMDLVVGGTSIVWYENEDGQGTFSSPNTIIPVVNGGIDISAGDLNGDGTIDLAVTVSNNDNVVAWYKHVDGRGRFDRRQRRIASINSATSIDAVDLDADGDLDLLASSGHPTAGQVVWFENTDGSGRFQTRILQQEGDAIMAVTTGDFNSDGRIDVVSATHTGGKLQWVENLGVIGDANRDRVFDTSDLVHIFQFALYETGKPATDEQGDFNGDGKFDSADLVLAFRSSAFENTAEPLAASIMRDVAMHRTNDEHKTLTERQSDQPATWPELHPKASFQP